MNTKLIQEDKTCILKTSKLSKADIGTYKCVATNDAGAAECEAKVEGKLSCKNIWQTTKVVLKIFWLQLHVFNWI